jgi:tetrapyrrole (corrin/porphyrin) methylase-like protein
MSTTISSQPAVLPELTYGSVWLVGAGDGGEERLSPIAAHALSTADAVIHDPAVPQPLLDLVRPPRYREAAEPHRGIERSIKLARDGCRVVHLVEGKCNRAHRRRRSPLRRAECSVAHRPGRRRRVDRRCAGRPAAHSQDALVRANRPDRRPRRLAARSGDCRSAAATPDQLLDVRHCRLTAEVSRCKR